MNFPMLIQALIQKVRGRPVLSTVIGLAALALVVALIKTSGSPTQEWSFYDVKRGDFLISVVEGGTLEAVNEVVIRNEVEGTARIIFIVPEGSYVKKGQLLVELDSSSSQDAVNQQQINVEKAQFALIQAEQQLAIQKSVVDSEVQTATLKVEFAQSDLKKYLEGEALQLKRNTQIDITNVLENLKIAEERLEWTEALYKEGYESKSNLDKDRLSVSQGKLKLEQAQKALWMLETFDEPKKKRQLEAALQEAKEDLDRVKLQGERKLAQFQADVGTQKSTLELSRKKLERDLKQLAATKIHAPQDGLVVYAGGGGGGRFSSESMIEEGAVVRNRQELIKLPDVSEMKVQVKIHESHINQVRRGQPAFVVLDSMPDQRFQGLITKVAPLPDSSSRWANPNLKVYATEVLVTDNLPDVKPGVSARAEVVITNLANVLTVPIQAVTTRKGKQVVFLASAPQKPVPVTVGMYNIKFIEITSGVKEGDQVMLSPPFDTEEKDLGGSIIAQGEALPAADTNQLARAATRSSEGGDRGGFGPTRSRGETASEPRTLVDAANAPGEGGAAPRAEAGPRFNADGQRGGAGSEGVAGPADPERAGRRGGQRGEGGGRGFPNREEMMKQFDKNGDGELDETERAAMRERFGQRRRTNAPPATATQPESR
ncbi:MAG: efflux RND transporter periplasmic adaptor subunit [Verrucomicrobia bacterium]|nr:efflux RND transporter periplasmic adaptor subunit [Verrucomicrobiota bacterium]